MDQESAKEERKLQAMLDEAKKGVAELSKAVEEQVKRVEQVTKESPGLALTITFLAGLAVGGIIALLLSRKD